MRPTDRQRVLRRIAAGCLVVFVVSIAMIVLGDPFWNLYLVSLGLLVAPPVGLVAGGLLIWSRRSADQSSGI
jgi:hypothetical protein